jgi:hypothetical protein
MVTLLLNLAGLVVACVKVRQVMAGPPVAIVRQPGAHAGYMLRGSYGSSLGVASAAARMAEHGSVSDRPLPATPAKYRLRIRVSVAPGTSASEVEAILLQEARRAIRRGAKGVSVIVYESVFEANRIVGMMWPEGRVVGLIIPPNDSSTPRSVAEELRCLNQHDGYAMRVHNKWYTRLSR